MSRKGFELAVGTLVVMVLGLLIVIGGSMLVWDITEKGLEINKEVAAAQQGRVRDLLTQGQLLAIYPSVQSVRPGKSATTTLGIRNMLDTTTTFTIGVDVLNATGGKVDAFWKILGDGEQATIGRGEMQEVIVLVQPPSAVAVGTYTVLVTVTSGVGEIYTDAPVSFSVRVE